MTSYADFLIAKTAIAHGEGVTVDDADINPVLFPFQRDLTRWALRKGRAAIFADTGLGKTFMQVEWARLTGERTLIAAPLSVARQTVAEAMRLGVEVKYARSQADAGQITITNYEMLDHFAAAAFGAIVLDESSILKSYDGKTRTRLIEQFRNTPLRLCCTATPAPNDIAELANHAEFLGILTRAEMLASFFVHDDEGWRLKGHAQEPFYRWLASWGMTLKTPSDLGYSDEGYILPGLEIVPHIIKVDYAPEGQMLFTKLKGIGDRSAVRKETLTERVETAAKLINESDEPWIAWVGLNQEGIDLAALIPDCVLIEGSQTPESKAERLEKFIDGRVRVMVSKCSISGYGLNLQRCSRMVFVGLSDSYEQYYQAIRRCYRFGQTQRVEAHIVITEPEEAVYENVLRKEREADSMTRKLVKEAASYEKAEIADGKRAFTYAEREETGDGWRMMLGDSAERLKALPDDSVDLSVFSPPFMSLYTYSATERDLGNARTPVEFWEHFNYIIPELLRVTKPGRNVAVHVAQVTTTLASQGVIGLVDFRGETIRAFIAQGFVYHGEVCIDKDPQAQAIRTHSKALLFVQLRKDSSWLRPALADYILVFRKPGDNAVPVHADITNNEWIEWARPIWYGIKESDTLNVVEARSEEDERHMCALQLGTIERCVRLWSNKGETVLSPFGGIGSEGYEALRHGRKYIGIELKPEYFEVACRNLKRAEANKRDLFSYTNGDVPADMPSTGEVPVKPKCGSRVPL